MQSNGLKLVKPYGFGYETVWLAVKSKSPTDVFEVLTKYNVAGKVFNQHVNGFVLVTDVNIDELLDDEYIENDQVSDEVKLRSENIVLLKNLSKELGLVCFFLTESVSDVHQWLRAENGEIIRAFHHYIIVNLNYGLTPEEEALGYDFKDYNELFTLNEGILDLYPDEECVVNIAGKWSVDPRTLNELYGEKPNGAATAASPVTPAAESSASEDKFWVEQRQIEEAERLERERIKQRKKRRFFYKCIGAAIALIAGLSQIKDNQRPVPRGVEPTSLITLALTEDNEIIRSNIPDSLSKSKLVWVITVDGEQRINHGIDDEKFGGILSKGRTYEIHMAVIDGNPQDKVTVRVSNVVTVET